MFALQTGREMRFAFSLSQRVGSFELFAFEFYPRTNSHIVGGGIVSSFPWNLTRAHGHYEQAERPNYVLSAKRQVFFLRVKTIKITWNVDTLQKDRTDEKTSTICTGHARSRALASEASVWWVRTVLLPSLECWLLETISRLKIKAKNFQQKLTNYQWVQDNHLSHYDTQRRTSHCRHPASRAWEGGRQKQELKPPFFLRLKALTLSSSSKEHKPSARLSFSPKLDRMWTSSLAGTFPRPPLSCALNAARMSCWHFSTWECWYISSRNVPKSIRPPVQGEKEQTAVITWRSTTHSHRPGIPNYPAVHFISSGRIPIRVRCEWAFSSATRYSTKKYLVRVLPKQNPSPLP